MQTATDTAARVAGTDTQTGSKEVRKPLAKVELFGLRALWLHFADEMDLRRLAKLHVRIRVKERALHDLKEERRQIMRKCTRRMQRAQAKN
ncbi:hypothetical protein KUV26_03810 [Leisingera daeponensis]|uniref:Uncharacterized protein n=1 Tax=Leisingera daeponensis TaxID=405746 RepID=A0ABS7NBG8_9RHOB|nr:hypothetical protein [Leisingera daeponensis]MBY6138552.1 hypothetical protein [Leisingera daeponensis]